MGYWDVVATFQPIKQKRGSVQIAQTPAFAWKKKKAPHREPIRRGNHEIIIKQTMERWGKCHWHTTPEPQ